MKNFSFLKNGKVVGTFTGKSKDLGANTPPNCVAVPGRRTLDPVPNPQATIEALEGRQLRAMRELTLDPANADARRRLLEIESDIAIERAKL